jgi:hypothetical protein
VHMQGDAAISTTRIIIASLFCGHQWVVRNQEQSGRGDGEGCGPVADPRSAG